MYKWAQEKLFYHEETFERTRPGEGQPCVVSETEERKKKDYREKILTMGVNYMHLSYIKASEVKRLELLAI